MSGRSFSAAERAMRAKRICAARDSGDSAEQIARREGISSRQVRRTLAAERLPECGMTAGRATDAFELDPFAEIAECVRTHREAIGVVQTIGRRSANDAVRLGAAKAAPTLASSLLEVLERVGLLPVEVVHWAGENQWRNAWRVIGETLREMGVDSSEFVKLLEAKMSSQVFGKPVKLVGLGPMWDRA